MEIKIGKITIGDQLPCVVIPEAGDNHRGTLDGAKALALAAKEAGADIIKFQLHLPDEEMDRAGMQATSSEMFQKWGDLYGFISQNLLSVGDHEKLIQYCKEIDIQYFCTPFSLKAAYILKEIGGDVAYKIGSGETEDLPMIESVADLGKPMIISTGMSTYEEVDLTVAAVRKRQIPLALMHCISTYPPKSLAELHLGVIRELRQRYGVLVGFSDHTPPEGVAAQNGDAITERELMWGALGAGACFVEKHFTTDRHAPDADSRFSHDPETLRRLIADIRLIESALDTRREVFEHEHGVWVWAKRSLFAARNIAKGTVLTRDDITSKRPGTGIRSKEYQTYMGKTLARDIRGGEMLQVSDFI